MGIRVPHTPGRILIKSDFDSTGEYFYITNKREETNPCKNEFIKDQDKKGWTLE